MRPTLTYLPTRFTMLTKVGARNALLRTTSPFFRRYPPRTDGNFINNRPVFSDDKKYMFLNIPKAASSTVLSNLYFGEYGAAAGWREQAAFRKRKTFSHLSKYEIFLILEKYFTFTFVRNPYTRLASAYLDKIARVRKGSAADIGRRRRVAQYAGRDPTEDISFDTFLDYLDFGKGIYGDPHWALQSALLGLPVDRIEFIGSLENIETDLAYVLERIFGENFSAKTFAPHATDAGRLARTLGDDEKRRIYRLYEADFDSFGYAKAETASGPARPTVANGAVGRPHRR